VAPLHPGCALSSGRGEWSGHAIGHALAEHRVEHIDAAAGEAQDGLVVALALSALAVVVSARRRVLQAGKGSQEQRVLEAVVAKPAGQVGIDGCTRSPWLRSQAGIRRQVSRRLEACARSRKADTPDGPGTHLGWGFAWPSNRRIMYNRASADPSGQPWSERKKYMYWDANGGPEQKGAWVGPDKPDFSIEKRPDYEPDFGAGPQIGMDAHDGRSPFMMSADGKAWLFVPSGLKDGPLPTHYEPVESPVKNPMYGRQDNPVAKKWDRPDNPYHAVGDPRYPYVITTYRLTEHHSGGIPTRMVPSTAELQPEGFVELSPELAATLQVHTLDWLVVSTARGEVEAKALVTERMRPLEIDGQQIHQVGMPFHFGWHGYATGDLVNTLSAIVGDPNTTIHEGKAFTCNVRKGRLRRGQSGVGHIDRSEA